ncbi:type VI secretion system-associated protein TagF [Vibrio rotiferianus]|uniref:Type VI secretion system-associated protein TagF n=1 Tax=Vibrio rotiferianus TaxID=190895 RepID=A0A7Y3Z6K1_9VIBR|nr:type VI secretion system-associated protein TagF [Vibrio rotiferianus]NOH47429.1 type VI secretion system-associated protein TagF [Vibrio rotiferianus]PIB12717.1 protein phosphatase ImpM [Vibrio rotiferianus CAIM 577 = LMG 21460]
MSTNLITESWGYIGKIPSKGDFIKEGLPSEFVSQFHDWQQAVLAVSKEQLNETWVELFLNAPIWHFALDQNYIGGATYIGTLIPSVDAAGRYFHFSVVRPVRGRAIDYWESRDWTQTTERLALEVLGDEFQFDKWHHNLKETGEGLDTIEPTSYIAELLDPSTSNAVFRFSELFGQRVLLNHMLATKGNHPCFWWTEGAQAVESSMVITSGLPSIGQFSAMLDGNWKQWGW